ncbi:MAG: DUF166 domain-containing protein [Candidatus Freyarchaeota archaeon]
MIRILVVERGIYGERVVETINKYGNERFKVVRRFKLPRELPELIDEPEGYFPRGVFEGVDVAYLYTLHPDLTIQGVLEACKAGLSAVIIPGEDPTFKGAASKEELQRVAEGKIDVFVPRVSCALHPPTGNRVVDQLAERFGMPEIHVSLHGQRVLSVNVVRGAPCGATWYVARNLTGERFPDADALRRKAGLLAQYYCRAPRGYSPFEDVKGIHLAGELHAKSVKIIKLK